MCKYTHERWVTELRSGVKIIKKEVNSLMSWFKYWMTWILREVGLSVREGYRGRRDKSLENQDWPWPCQLPNVWGRLATMDEHMKVHRQMGGVPCGGFDPTTIQYIRCHVSFEHSAESFFHICTSLLTSFLKVFFFFLPSIPPLRIKIQNLDGVRK